MYDGIKFNNYSKQDGLANELVNDVIEISPDSLLIATNAPDLNVMVNGKIESYQTTDGFYPVINRFFKSNDGFLYVTADDGLFRMTNNKFVRIPLLNEENENIGLNLDRIVEWNTYLLIIPWNFPQKEKLIIYDHRSEKVVASITDKKINSVAVTPKNELWLSSPDGIERMDPASLERGKVQLLPLADSDFGKGWPNSILYFDPMGNALVLANDAFMQLANDGNKYVFSSTQGLKTSNLTDIFVDREGIIWLASDGNGIVKMPGTNVQILNDLKPGVKNNLRVLCQHSDTAWTFNYTDRSIYSIHDNIITTFPLEAGTNEISSIFILGNSLYYITGNNLYHIRNKDIPASYLDPVIVIPDTSGILELGSGLVDLNGRIILNVRKDETTFYLAVIHDQKVLMKSPLSFMVDHLALDKEGQLWVSTRDNHLKVYSVHPDTPSRYLQLIQDFSSEIEGINPRSITVDNTGKVWIGTRYNGIYMLNFLGNKLIASSQFTTTDGLTDNFEYYLHSDINNNIWVGSRTGLDKIYLDNDEYIIENITKSNGIFQGIYKIINADDDTVWALMSDGNILSVTSGTSYPVITPPPLLITYFAINDESQDIRSSKFSHNQNNLSISVAASSFLDEKSILYSYLLEGGTKTNWSDPSNNAHFNFINLAPGAYTLNIKAEFPAKRYPAQTVQYAFVIQPPFWRTWWFMSLGILFTIGILGILLQDHYGKKLEAQKIQLENKQAIEKERTRIATDMHDDLGAGLSRIKFLSEIMGIKKQKHLPIEEDIYNIRNYADDMIHKMGEIVWALNEKNDSLSDLLSYTRAYAVEYLAENGITGIIGKLPPLTSVMMKGEYRRNIYLSVKEALHNVVKHAKANTVTIHFEANKELVISIKDDGIGFDHGSVSPFRNGLPNIRKRMADIGGKVDIINDQGTTVILTAPLG